MRPPLSRLAVFGAALLLAVAASAQVRRSPLAPALELARTSPAFRQSLIAQIGLVTSLSAQPQPSLAPLLSAEPSPADPWQGESARLVGLLASDPQALSAAQEDLKAALGDHQVDVLGKAASRLRQSAASGGPVAAELERLKRKLDLADASSMEALSSRLNAIFEASRSQPEGSPAVDAGATSKKPLVALVKPGEKPPLSREELKAYVAERSETSPRGLRRINFASGDYRPEYDDELHKLGADVLVIKTPSRGEISSFKEEDGYHLKSEYVRWVMAARTLEEHEALISNARVRNQFRRKLKDSEDLPREIGPLSPEKFEQWYPIYEEEVVGKPGGKRNVDRDFARKKAEAGTLSGWYGLFYYDPQDRSRMVGGVVMKSWPERGMFVLGYAAYRPEIKDLSPSLRSFVETLSLARRLGFKVSSFGQDTNFFGYDYNLGLMSSKSGLLFTPYPEDEIVLMKVLDTAKIGSVKNKKGLNEGYFFFGIKRESPLVERYLASREAGSPKEAQELLGGGYFTPEILPAGETTLAWRFRGDDPTPLRTPPGIEVIERPMDAPPERPAP